MTLQKIVINVSGQTDLNSTIKQLTQLGLIDEKNAKSFLKNNKSTQNALDQTNNKLGTVSKSLTNIEKALIGAFTVSQVINLGQKIIETTAKFEKFEAVLTNTLGSKSAAQAALNQIKDFAAKTPFSVAELTESFVKLANQGFKPTQVEMRKLGDLAASTGKSFDQLTEAIIDAQTGEFERLKEFGIRAQKEGDKVKFTFKGVETQTQFTASAIRDYVLGLGDAVGVSGSMAAISETVGGKISNMGDAFDSLFNSLGSANSGLLKDTIEAITSIVQGIEIALLTQEQLQKRLDDIANSSRKGFFFGSVEKDIKELTKIMDADEARSLVFRNQLINAEKELEIINNQLARQRRLAGDMASNEERAIIKELEADQRYFTEIITEIDEQLTKLDKKEIERIKAEEQHQRDLDEQRKKDAEKARKRREEAFKREIEQLKAHMNKLENDEKESYLNREINQQEFDQNIHDLSIQSVQKEIIIYKKYGKDISELEKKILDDRIDQRKEADKKLLDNSIKTVKGSNEIIKQSIDFGKKAAEEAAKIDKQRQDSIKKSHEIAKEFALTAINQVTEGIEEGEKRRLQAQLDRIKVEEGNEIAALDKKHKRGKLSDEAYEAQKAAIQEKSRKREAALKTKQAQDDKKIALLQIAINTAAAVVKGIAIFGPPPSPAGITAIASAIGLGAIEAGIAAATPIPKFKDGVIDFKGKGTSTSDSNLALLSNGESVMTAKETRNYRKELEAMRNGTYERYRDPVMRRKSLTDVRNDNMVENIYKSMMLQNGFDDQKIVAAIKDTKRAGDADRKLANMIGSKIADRAAEDKLFR